MKKVATKIKSETKRNKKTSKIGKASETDLSIPVVFRSEPEGGFTALVPSLPGCVTFGKDITEAEKMAREAIELYLEDAIADGEYFPESSSAYLSNINIKVADINPHHRIYA